MPSTNVTIDDVSALVQYTPLGDAWKDSPTSDSGLGSYFDGTYHSTNVYGSAATFQFDGTAGPFVIHLDGQPVYNGTFQSNASIYKQLMYGVSGLTPGTHTLTCTNDDPTNQTYTEVDFITWTTSMDSSLTETFGSPIAVSNMNYSSTAAWQQATDSEPTMVTATDGASVTIYFQGNGIQLEGKTGAAFGAFSAQVDNNPVRQLNAQSAQTHSSLLFRQDNLASGNHTLVITNRGGGFTSLAIGSATPIIWSNSPNPSSPSSSSASSHAGVIAGAVVGAVVGLAALLLALFWFFRRRRQARHAQEEDVVRPTKEPAFIDATPFVLPPTQTASSVRGSNIGDDPMQSGMSMYRAVPGSPGMSSRGSFDYGPGGMGMGMAGSSNAGTSVGWARGGKGSRHSGPTMRPEIDEEVLRDRDAGPVLLPQLPPAYSSATAGAMSDPPSISGPSPVPTTLTPVPEAVQGGGALHPHGGSPAPAPSPSPSPQPGPA
ncbi:hypothetical protein FRC10_001653 [Ceratobasidium sp. 414]|nr:hypothetical protein FRC10_001653 [Ceratobasidium sp. 414]